jgi:hypothetical protein
MVRARSVGSPVTVKLACACDESRVVHDTASPASADGSHTDSPATRPAAERVMSGPAALTRGMIPRSFHTNHLQRPAHGSLDVFEERGEVRQSLIPPFHG